MMPELSQIRRKFFTQFFLFFVWTSILPICSQFFFSFQFGQAKDVYFGISWLYFGCRFVIFLLQMLSFFRMAVPSPRRWKKKKRFNTAFWTGKKKSGFVFPLLHLLSLSSLTHIFFFIYLQLKVKGMLLSHVQASSLSFV